MKYIIIGAGISGLAVANILQDTGNQVIIFEKQSRPGGMIKCDTINGSLFHCTGGHVFNTKRNDVLKWFWEHFNKDTEFIQAFRNSAVVMANGTNIPYPIENHIYKLEEKTQKAFINDLLEISKKTDDKPINFEDFLKKQFGRTLYDLYFHPYNYKIWRRDLNKVPLSWLEGKLPMPTVEEMIYNNMNHVEERIFVHSAFYYPTKGGSQFLANRLSERLDIRYNTPVTKILYNKNHLTVNNIHADRIIFCGNVKELPFIIKDCKGINIDSYIESIEKLDFHGTTSVFCEIEKNDYSWLYLPSSKYDSHRIICTGNFSKNNDTLNIMTGTIEFTDYISKDNILNNLRNMPYSPKYLTHHFEPYTYPIQDNHTRKMILSLKKNLDLHGIYLVGRFAEWEYYNMDMAIASGIDLIKQIL